MKRKLFILLLVLGISTSLKAQPPGGGCNPDFEEEFDCDDESIPLDDGVVFLLTSSLAFGLYKIKEIRTKRTLETH